MDGSVLKVYDSIMLYTVLCMLIPSWRPVVCFLTTAPIPTVPPPPSSSNVNGIIIGNTVCAVIFAIVVVIIVIFCCKRKCTLRKNTTAQSQDQRSTQFTNEAVRCSVFYIDRGQQQDGGQPKLRVSLPGRAEVNRSTSSGPSPGAYCTLDGDYNIHSLGRGNGYLHHSASTLDLGDHYDELPICPAHAGPTGTADNAHAHMPGMENAPAHPTVISHDEYDHIPNMCSLLTPQQSIVSDNEYDEIPSSLQSPINNHQPQFIVMEANADQEVLALRSKPALVADVNVHTTESTDHTGYYTAAYIMSNSDEGGSADDSVEEVGLLQFAEKQNPSTLSNFDPTYATCADIGTRTAALDVEQARVVDNLNGQVSAASLISNVSKVIVVDNEVYDQTPEPATILSCPVDGFSPWVQSDERWVQQTKPLMVIIADNDIYERTPEPTDTHDSSQHYHIGHQAGSSQSRGHPNLRVSLPTRTAEDKHEFAGSSPGSSPESVDDLQYSCTKPVMLRGNRYSCNANYPEAVGGFYEEFYINATDRQPMATSDDDEVHQTKPLMVIIADNDIYERTPEPTDTHDSSQQCHIGHQAGSSQSRGHPILRVSLPTRTTEEKHEFAGSSLESVDDFQYSCTMPTMRRGNRYSCNAKYPEAVGGSYEELPISATDGQSMAVSDDNELSRTPGIDNITVQPKTIASKDPIYNIPRKQTKTDL